MQIKQWLGLVLLLAGIGGCGGGSIGSVNIDPEVVNLSTGQQQIFTVSITQCSGTQIDWSVDEGVSGGSVTSDGVYTAPSETGTYHVRATCSSDSHVYAIAYVTVN